MLHIWALPFLFNKESEMKALRVKFLFVNQLYKQNKLPAHICVLFPPLAFSLSIELARSLFELRKSSLSCCIVFELRKKTPLYFAEETFAFTFSCARRKQWIKTINAKTPCASTADKLNPGTPTL